MPASTDFTRYRNHKKLPPLSVALAYRQLWKVEAIFKTAKAILETRPIYHQSDTTIAGHLFCSFLGFAAAQGAGRATRSRQRNGGMG